MGLKLLANCQQKSDPKRHEKTNREDLGDPDPYKMVGRERGGDIMQELTNNLNDILTDPQKYQKYQQDLDKYAWEQARIYATLGQFLSTLGLGHIFQQGSGILD